ncbi:aminoglycoside N(3)-acetyltransferase [Levilactobacillus brevis]|uniref:aminoglycoside N(3)-acetyltransferase n=1 Tax=Levilactobacillus brevis TaxID=1580 RepID=UPI00339C1958
MQLRDVGIEKGDTIIVHTSLKSFGWLVSGSRSVITALCKAVGDKGNIVMPSQTPELSDPKTWTEDPEPQEDWESIENKTLGYSERLTPVIGQSCVAEAFRHYPNVLRSNHPLDSFCAWGEKASWIVKSNAYDFPFGDEGVLGKLYSLGAKIVLIGTDFETNTSLHLAETRVNKEIKIVKETAPVETGTLLLPCSEKIQFNNIELDTFDFSKIESAYLQVPGVEKKVELPKGSLRVFDMRNCVKFAENEMKNEVYK